VQIAGSAWGQLAQKTLLRVETTLTVQDVRKEPGLKGSKLNPDTQGEMKEQGLRS
jgi:hypothetical protein